MHVNGLHRQARELSALEFHEVFFFVCERHLRQVLTLRTLIMIGSKRRLGHAVLVILAQRCEGRIPFERRSASIRVQVLLLFLRLAMALPLSVLVSK